MSATALAGLSPAAIDGAALGPAWALPFVGLLLSIALLPLAVPAFWHRHHGTVAAGWSLALLLPLAAVFGPAAAAHLLWHALLAEYLPFVVLLTALFTVAGGIHLRGTLSGSTTGNAALLASGAALASVMGTTGASMLLIRPLLRANAQRRDGGAHVVVFFIFIVANAGGALTPLGDPPLFLGFLQGVDFFWTLHHLWPQTLFLVGALLAVFCVVDRWQTARWPAPADAPPAPRAPFGIDGGANLLPLAAIVGLVLTGGAWQPGIAFDVFGTPLGLQSLLRDAALGVVVAVSLAITPRGIREANAFSWAPMAEVARLFAAIFVTMAPVLAVLGAGRRGAFAGVAAAVSGAGGEPLPRAYFWLTGALSAFLDNAPTYRVFFRLAGGDAPTLMTTHAATLAAISAGAVFMGAASYIGNAPNFMVKAIAEDRGVRMPGFFGYLLWSGAVLLPLFAAMTLIWF